MQIIKVCDKCGEELCSHRQAEQRLYRMMWKNESFAREARQDNERSIHQSILKIARDIDAG